MSATYLDNIQLYYFNTCPYCIKVLLAIKMMGVDLVQKNIHSSANHKAELIEGGGKKQVPCLRIEEGAGVRWLYESNDIIEYLKSVKGS
ncbi:glutathione S-transferase N-terminal domain-containing protein [Shewanella nanhaiensis]|uniref:Glutathione S-transferase N-terminal domain-containing protein n=1 Tax=Shewanella nanhaiensis TaxID=2864872 RepID=A0ABS7E5H8_9GAMM|nr:glutathione S-transferase N-terminal domain-containing protein [Shewanella nanhaiensis]MBW8184849.1 glutathione S-transferase N-terminal domain-containing protein [Shewanella nanhaiensis]